MQSEIAIDGGKWIRPDGRVFPKMSVKTRKWREIQHGFAGLLGYSGRKPWGTNDFKSGKALTLTRREKIQ